MPCPYQSTTAYVPSMVPGTVPDVIYRLYTYNHIEINDMCNTGSQLIGFVTPQRDRNGKGRLMEKSHGLDG